MRSEVLLTTATLARLSRSDEIRLAQPLVAKRDLRLWYAPPSGVLGPGIRWKQPCICFATYRPTTTFLNAPRN